MRDLPFYWIDAFTTKLLGGNPCAVLLDADELAPDEMQAIAREMNLSETAFVMKPSAPGAEIRARYFTPESEIPLAGHPTMAVMRALVDAGRIVLSGHPKTILLQLEAGVISVELQPDAQGLRIIMTQLTPKFMKTYDRSEILPAIGLSESDLLEGVPLQTVSTGSQFLMVALKDHAALKKVKLDVEKFRALLGHGDFRSAHFFCLPGLSAGAATFARHPGLPPELEDPFTGSATGCMGAYAWKYSLIAEPRFVAEQGHWMGRAGQAEVELVGPRQAIQTVRVAGRAVTLIEGGFRTHAEK